MAEFNVTRTRPMWLVEKSVVEADTKEQALAIAESGDIDDWLFVYEEDQDGPPLFEAEPL